MSDAAQLVDAVVGELEPDLPSAPAHGRTCGAIPDMADTCAIDLERARRLGRELRVQVAIDVTGWLRSSAELVFTRASDGAIWPVKVRVGREASDQEILARGGVIARCAQYNAAIRTLRQLGERLDAMLHQGQITLAPGSAVAYAHRELSRLDELIARRQVTSMGHSVVDLATFAREIEFYERCDAHLAPIVDAAERAARTAQPRDASPPRPARRWLRWLSTRGGT